MKSTKLSQHIFKKGKFITPLNDIPQMRSLQDNESWTYGRLPEYIWIALIFEKFGRKEGLEKLYHIIKKLCMLSSDIIDLKLSSILKMDDDVQSKFYQEISAQTSYGTLAPLTLIFTVSEYPIFTRNFYSNKLSIEQRKDILLSTMKKVMGHQTDESTDIRFIVLWFNVTYGKLCLLDDDASLLSRYPQLDHENEAMCMIRPFIRSCESILVENSNDVYLNNFWRCISKMTDCNLIAVKYPDEESNITLYAEYLHEIFVYLNNLYKTSYPIDEKMSVILGISTYSYKRFTEVCEHNLYNAISGRGCVRILIENYIMLKYLLKNEATHENIWRDYKIYGTGLYKLVLSRHREAELREKSHIDTTYLEALVNEFWIEDFIDMDTKYFDKHNIRLKAEQVGEKDLYGLYYDYDSSFEHGMWGAIRESSLLKCENPAHQYHCVPDINNDVQLKSVLPDCVMMINKTIELLDSLYDVPEKLFKEVANFEI